MPNLGFRVSIITGLLGIQESRGFTSSGSCPSMYPLKPKPEAPLWNL